MADARADAQTVPAALNNPEGGKNPLGLYIHIPFCARKCPYCDFYSTPYHRKTAEAYTQALCADLKEQAFHIGSSDSISQGLSFSQSTLEVDTVYFGGGTPSLIPPEFIASILSTVREVFRLNPLSEITLEANPNTVSPERLAQYRLSGINRISLGMQSALPEELSALGRSHSVSQVEKAVFMAMEANILNLSLDVMLGTPGQTWNSVQKTLEFAVALPISHLSAYLLKAEPETPYWNSPLLARCAGDEELADIYLNTVSFLEQRGLLQYEISNFAKPGCESRHNLLYWRCQEYLGFGPAAHSHYHGQRYGNTRDLDAYLDAPGKTAIVTDEDAGSPEEILMLGLRLAEGLPLTFPDILPPENRRRFWEKTDLLKSAGYLSFGTERFRLTAKGFLLSNSIIAELLQYFP